MNRRSFVKNSALCAAMLRDAPAARSMNKNVRDSPATPPPAGVNAEKLRRAAQGACGWLTNVAQVKSGSLHEGKNSLGYNYSNWTGAIRDEYSVADGTWDFFGPIWHTGQAVKALVRAAAALDDPGLLIAARVSAGFIGNQRITDKSDPNYGLILAFEDQGSVVNTSAIIECLDGLMLLSDATGDGKYMDWAEAAGHWVAERAYLGKGLFRDSFSVKSWGFVPPSWANRVPPHPGRPLLDDAIFLKLALRTGNARYREIFYATANRLLRDEDPPGNWINYAPCNAKRRMLHPRQAYWWGYPMLAAYKDSGDRKYLDCARRAGVWYRNAMRLDGGLFRHTRVDFKTTSFRQATSGIGCAAKLWHGLWLEDKDPAWRKMIGSALKFQMEMQFRTPRDPNLKGAVLEESLRPDGTDRSPYHIRDLAAIFFLQSAAPFLGGTR